MTPTQLNKLDQELSSFLSEMTDGMGRPERRRALEWYLTGLLLDGRKTVVGMASRLVDDECEIEAMRQRLQQCVTISTWADEELRRRLSLKVETALEPEAFILDDTGFPKKGELSVGVHRQYSGTLGRIGNCQVATSLHMATNETSACIGMRLYLPEEWASDIPRRRQAGIPDDVVFKRKWQIGIDLLDEALATGLSERIVIADAAFGDSTDFRDALDERNCPFVLGIAGHHMTWPPGSRPRPPKNRSVRGRPLSRFQDGKKKPLQIRDVEFQYRKFSCSDGQGGEKAGHFAFHRVHLAERHTKGRPPSEELWLISEWRPAKKEYRFYISNLPASTAKRELARLIKLRWRVERDYQELKGEIGLDHFEGRTWRGFHHHVTLCSIAHGFLALQRRRFPPKTIPLDLANGQTSFPTNPSSTNRHLPAV